MINHPSLLRPGTVDAHASNGRKRDAKIVRRLSLLAALIAILTAPALVEAGERAAVEQHLRTVPKGAVVLGRSAPDSAVGVVIGFPWHDEKELARLLRAVRDPKSPEYGRFLSARDFSRRFAPRTREVAATMRYLHRAGLKVVDIAPSRALLTVTGPAARVEEALSTPLVEITHQGRRQTMAAATPVLPAELSGQVLAVGSADELRPLVNDTMRMEPASAPFAPSDIARVYGFDHLYTTDRRGEDARHSTIAVATAFAYDPADVEAFWAEEGIDRRSDLTELIPVAGAMEPTTPSSSDTLESTLDVEWAGAMAPNARVLAYAGTDASSSTFLRIYDRIVSENRAAVMTTSWGRCERDYPKSFLAQADAIFQRAAAQGITVVAAAGDRGAFECGGDTPSVSFPASHPYVLAVGGTSLVNRGVGLEETVWASSGGATSARFAAPPWQMEAESGRVLSDVAVNADPDSGYITRHAGNRILVGGTSVGAPVWAALIAIANQSRMTAGRATLGLAAPELCELAYAKALVPAPLVDIVSGSNGLGAAPGWDFPTGWGTPNADALVAALSDWTPPANGVGGVTEVVTLNAAHDDTAGAARLRIRRRCLSSGMVVHLRGLAPGTYALVVDGQPIASVTTDRAGDAIATVPGVEIRGLGVELLDADGVVRFANDEALPDDDTTVQAEAALTNTGFAPAATGTITYRASGVREQLVVRMEGLPGGTYEIRLGSSRLGTVTARDGFVTEVTYDSLGMSGPQLPSSPLCTSVLVLRGGSAYLRSVVDALTPGACRN